MKRHFFYYLLLAGFVVLSGCKSKDDKAADAANATDSTVIDVEVDSGFTEKTIDSFKTTGFSTYAKQRAPQFDWTKFKKTLEWKEDTLVQHVYKPDKKFYASYGPFLKWSPDSSKFIDLDSYNIDIRKNKHGKLIGAELGPDTEVSMVNPKTGQKTRLLFLGPGSSVEDGLWLDNNNLVLMGVQDYGDSLGKTAAVWKFNIPTQTFTLYEMHDSKMAQQLMGSWRKERLKGIAR
jgi:hypothetical protein